MAARHRERQERVYFMTKRGIAYEIRIEVPKVTPFLHLKPADGTMAGTSSHNTYPPDEDTSVGEYARHHLRSKKKSNRSPPRCAMIADRRE